MLRLLLILSFLVISCGKEDKQRQMCVVYGEDCHPDRDKDEPKVVVKEGPRGPAGPKGDKGDTGPIGPPGVNGYSVVYEIVTNVVDCQNGGYTVIMGIDTNRTGLLDINEDSNIQSMEVCNGLDGEDGQDGEDAAPTAFTPTELVNPCGDALGVYDEVFLRLANNMLVASFSENVNGKNTRFSILVPGNYVTTDGDSCSFTVDSNLDIINESHTY